MYTLLDFQGNIDLFSLEIYTIQPYFNFELYYTIHYNIYYHTDFLPY